MPVLGKARKPRIFVNWESLKGVEIQESKILFYVNGIRPPNYIESTTPEPTEHSPPHFEWVFEARYRGPG